VPVTWQAEGVGQPSVVECDTAATRRRIKRLRRYVTTNLLNSDRFICPHAKGCKASCTDGEVFRPGTMSHVGHRYDLLLNGKELRIVVVGQESGWPKGPGSTAKASKVSLAARYAAVHADTGLNRRYYATADYEGRNPHMRGTTSALRAIFGHDVGTDFAGEWVCPENDKPFHLFDAFALVNRLLCSAGPPGSSAGHPAKVMRDNCLGHADLVVNSNWPSRTGSPMPETAVPPVDPVPVVLPLPPPLATVAMITIRTSSPIPPKTHLPM
jgi:hypothetical protein